MTTFIDCGSGVAGDMLLGAMIGLGLPAKELERTLQAAIREPGWKLLITPTERQTWPAWSLQVKGDRTYGSLEKMRTCVKRSSLPAPVKKNALEIFARLAKAEAEAHGRHRPDIDPKGLGLIDTLVDVLGTSWGFWKLGIEDVIASPINTGRLAPATAAMLRKSKVPVFSKTSTLELATPTGVAILLQFAHKFEPMPEMQLQKTGYGAGTQDIPGKPNVLSIYQGTPVKTVNSVMSVKSVTQPNQPSQPTQPSKPAVETVLLLETVIDDMDPRLYPHVMDLLFKEGALDVWWTPIGMKKGRPGIAFTVICRPSDEMKILKRLFQETTTLGIRRLPVERWTLPRKEQGLRKIAYLPGGRTKVQTEFDVARKTAASRATPLLKLLK
jgi:uncharacterized protein (TIGR00299 family) protein